MEQPDLALLVTLDALLQEASVTRAAVRLGLSTPATSHALARIRAQLGDPILVRAGRGMVRTPRAESLRDEVHRIVDAARAAMTPERPFVPSEVDRTFVVNVTDHVLSVLGVALDAILAVEAPGLSLRFVPNSPDDAAALRQGTSDLAVGIYGELPPEMRSRPLMTDRFVCVVREDHPRVGKRLSLEQFAAMPHIQVAPRGLPGGYIDDAIRERGYSRRVARAVPYFLTALHLAARTDYLLTISERVARSLGPSLGLRILEPPLPLRPYALSLVWHPRFDGDEAHRFLREAFVRAARSQAGDRHPAARRRLDDSDPTSGRPRKRRGRPAR